MDNLWKMDENGDLMGFNGIYPLVMTVTENYGLRSTVFIMGKLTKFLWSFSMAILINYQRVEIMTCSKLRLHSFTLEDTFLRPTRVQTFCRRRR